MFDNHVHTSFSGDSELNPEEAINKAIEKKLNGIAFTDHLDIDYPGYNDYFMIDFNKYSEYMNSIKQKYKNKIKILKGIEVGLQPHVLQETNSIVNDYSFDFVIGSIHVVNKTDLHNGDFCRNKSKKVAYQGYFEEVLKLIKEYTNFDILGHLDLIRRYGDYDNKNLNYLDYRDVIDEILNVIIINNKGIEINMSSYKYGLNTPMPNFDIVKRYKELGGENLTIGSDSHSIEYIGYNFKEIISNLKLIGFKYLVHFEKRKIIYDRI